MVDLTDEADADWMARGRPEASDEEHAQLCGDVIARAGRRFFLVRPGIANGHDAADPLPLDTEASIFDADAPRHATARDGPRRYPYFELIDGAEVEGVEESTRAVARRTRSSADSATFQSTSSRVRTRRSMTRRPEAWRSDTAVESVMSIRIDDSDTIRARRGDDPRSNRSYLVGI